MSLGKHVFPDASTYIILRVNWEIVCILPEDSSSLFKVATRGGADLSMSFDAKAYIPWYSILGTVSL